MSKQTESNLFICPSTSQTAEFYQHLFIGIRTYAELGSRLLTEIRTAHSFRQIERVRKLAVVLSNLPLKEYQLAGQYYLALCQFRLTSECSDKALETIIEHTQRQKSGVLVSRGSFDIHRGNPEAAFPFYLEALKVNPTASEFIAASRGIALIKSAEGFHGSALKDLERLLPLLKFAEPLTYYDVLNSYAVELIENNRHAEAYSVSLVAASSPFGPYYLEWRETFSEARANTKRRSTVSIVSRQQAEVGEESEPLLNEIESRIQTSINYMEANFQRRLSVSEVAKVVNLSPGYFSRLFMLAIKLTPVQFLVKLRMEKTAQLLTTSFLSIKEIMVSVGYQSKSLFARHFRRYFEATPSEYRKRNRRALTFRS